MEEDNDLRRPLGMVLLTGLYLFFFLVTVSTSGNPFPFLGHIYIGTISQLLVLADSIICLYLFLGLYKRQLLTWYLLIGYNLFQIANTIVNLNSIPVGDLEKVVGQHIDQDALFVNNIAASLALLLLTQYIYRQKGFFTNRSKYLF